MSEKITIKVSRPKCMPRNDLYGEAEFYSFTLLPNDAERFKQGGILTFKLQEAESSVLVGVRVDASE